jgi:putative ABC transport system substrate-binding protein
MTVCGNPLGASFEKAGQSLGIAVSRSPVQCEREIASTMEVLASTPAYGVVVMPDTFTTVNRKRIVELATNYRLPAIYPWRYFATAGGLVAYGVDQVELFRQCARYVDRLLKGEKPKRSSGSDAVSFRTDNQS